MITLHDLVILGTAVPEQIRDGRKTVCIAAWHPDLKLIRIYPTRADMGIHRWQTCTVRVERNPQDSRAESWKLVGSKQWELLEIDSLGGRIPKTQRIEIIEKCTAVCPRDLDNERKSLAIIKAPDITRCGFQPNPTKPPRQSNLIGYATESFVSTKSNYPFVPKVTYRCANGHNHEGTLIEWGAYEWMRKNPNMLDRYWTNIHIDEPDWVNHLLIGNQCNARTSWIVIGILSMKTEGKGNVTRARQMLLSLGGN